MALALPAALVALLITTSSAQDSYISVRSSVAFILHGERTPLNGHVRPTLTPQGAQQLYNQGSFFRNRYLTNSTSADDAVEVRRPIVGVSPDAIDNRQLNVFSNNNGYNVASGLAFMQGLYPPNSDVFPFTDEGISMDHLANGTLAQYPLDGYQYPSIQSFSILDPNSIW